MRYLLYRISAVLLLFFYWKPTFYFKIFDILDFKMEMNAIVEIVPPVFNQRFPLTVINAALEIIPNFVVVIGV